MSDLVEYKSLDDVQQAFVFWESEGQAHAFGKALWKTADHLIRSDVGEQTYNFYSKHTLADKVMSVLLKNRSLSLCLTDGLRRLVIGYHARGLSTSQAIEMILFDTEMEDVTPFWLFQDANVCGYRNIHSFLVSRLSYLKPSHPRFPQKYAQDWRTERERYVDAIQEIPLTQPQEQLQRLSEHYTELETAYQNASVAIEKERFHKAMIRTMAAIHTITRDPGFRDTNAIPTAPPQVSFPKAETPALQPPQDDLTDLATHLKWDNPETLNEIQGCRQQILELLGVQKQITSQGGAEALNIAPALVESTLCYMMIVTHEVLMTIPEATDQDPDPKQLFHLRSETDGSPP